MKPTRRQFLKELATTSFAVTSLGTTLGASLFATPMVLPIETVKGAINDKLNCVVVGAARGRDHVVKLAANPLCVVTGVAEADEKRGISATLAAEEGQKFRPRFERDMRTFCEDTDVDAVFVASPNHWHALHTCWALAAGKHVFVEKPACHSITEGRAMINAALQAGKICQVGTQCRTIQSARQAIEFLRNGGIGDVRLVRGICYKRRTSLGPLGNWPIPPEVDFEIWNGPALLTEPLLTRKSLHYHWHWQRRYGNGDIGNQGVHQTDFGSWALDVSGHPSRILTYGGRLGYQGEHNDPHYIDAGDTPNTEVCLFDYNGEKSFVFEVRGLEVPRGEETPFGKTIVYGSEGTLTQLTYVHYVVQDKSGKIIREFRGGDPAFAEAFNSLDDMKLAGQLNHSEDGLHYNNFVEAVRANDKSLLHAPIEVGHYSTAVMLLGNMSYYLGEKNDASPAEIQKAVEAFPTGDDAKETLNRTIHHLQANQVNLDQTPLSLGVDLNFDGTNEKFINNPEADKLLVDTRRIGYELPYIPQRKKF